MAIATTDPRTGQVLKTFDELTDDQLEDRLARAAAAADSYRLTSHEQRAGWLRAAADILDKRTDEVAELMTLEMGKTKKASAAEIGKCAAVLRYYADHGAGFLADEPVDADSVNASKAYAHYLPIGVVLAIMPWNFPLWQAMRFAAPALAAGNVGLLKHASNVPQTALFMEELFRDAGFPDDVFQTLLIGSGKVDAVLRDDRVAAATLTGSEAAGVAVAHDRRRGAQEGRPRARRLRPVRGDAVGRPGQGRQGRHHLALPEQRPVLHLRQAVHRAHRRVRRVRRPVRQGDVGARRRRPDGGRHRRRPARQRAGPRGRRGAGQGRRRQGRRPCSSAASARTGDGWWFPPTLLAGVTEEMDMYLEEVFGPVAQVHRAEPTSRTRSGSPTSTRFGLGSNAWTNDADEQEVFIRDLAAGQTFINGMVASFPALPFGGVKASGHGRELAAHGIREFTNIKTVWVGK